MLSAATLNYWGGLPDRLFARAAGVLRRKNTVSEKDYLRSLEFYRRYENSAPPLELYSLSKTIPTLFQRESTTSFGGERITFSFASGYRVKNPAVREEFSANKKNAAAYFHLWRHEEKKQRKENRPLVLCLHGFLMGHRSLAEKMFRIEKLFKLGVDVALFVLPHHGERGGHFWNQKLLNPQNVPLTIEGLAQIQHDLNATILSLQELGYERIGLVGASLGGLAVMTRVTLKASEKFLFTIVPAVRLHDHLMPDQKLFSFPVTESLSKATSAALDLVTPQFAKPLIKKEDIAVVVHAGDRLNDIDSSRAWIDAWKIKNVVEVSGGHWLYFDRSARGRAWYAWLEKNGFIAAKNHKRKTA